MPPRTVDQAGRRRGGAAGGQHVVDDQDPLVGMDGVAVDLELVAPVLELVLLAGDCPRQLAGLAHRDERGAERVGDRRRRDEAAGFDTDDAVDRSSRNGSASSSTARRNASALPSSGVMSRNVTPACG